MKLYTLATVINDIVTRLPVSLTNLEVAEARAERLRSLTSKPIVVINVTAE